MFTRTFTNVYLCQIKIHRLIHLYLFTKADSDFFIFCKIRQRSNINLRLLKMMLNNRRTYSRLNKPELVHNWSSVRGRIKYETVLLSRISGILMLIWNVFIRFSGENNSTSQSMYKKLSTAKILLIVIKIRMTMGYYSRHGHLIVDV